MTCLVEKVGLHLPVWRKSFLVLMLAAGVPALEKAHAADSTPVVGWKLLAEGFAAPIALRSLPDESGRLLVADQAGIIYVLNREGQREPGPFLDLRDRQVTG